MTELESFDSLLNVWEKLGTRERKLLLTYGWRMYNGQLKYGKLTPGKKLWSYEAVEEALDAAVYLAALLNDTAEHALEKALVESKE